MRTFYLLISSLFLLCSCLIMPDSAQATIYTFIDENGGIHLTNVPIDPRYRPGIEAISRFNSESAYERYDHYIRHAAREYQIDPLLIKAVIKAESNFDRMAISKKGAKGLMQLMPETAQDMEVSNPFDPKANIIGGTRYLRKMLGLFKGDLRLALAAYNAGPERVKTAGEVPKFTETKKYISNVLGYYKQLQSSSSPHKKWKKTTY
ncbi:transglycosylase SLT domain-containing protein [Thermodesulfobacteriota bacterium]